MSKPQAKWPENWPQIPQPFLTADLEDSCEDRKLAPHEWSAQALEELARQIGVANDYYYPLIGAAQQLRQAGTALTTIANMKPTPIGDSGFVHGPKLLFDNCQRFARAALKFFRKRRRG